jgi:hypothetical protein
MIYAKKNVFSVVANGIVLALRYSEDVKGKIYPTHIR